jgi:hypothetical protein
MRLNSAVLMRYSTYAATSKQGCFMSTDRISDIRKQLAALEKEESKLLQKNRATALKEIKALIKINRFTAADLTPLFTEDKRRGRKPGPKPGAKRGRKPKDPSASAVSTAPRRRGRPRKNPLPE